MDLFLADVWSFAFFHDKLFDELPFFLPVTAVFENEGLPKFRGYSRKGFLENSLSSQHIKYNK
jgi:hypothetical protein